jgi:hypothetical protein
VFAQALRLSVISSQPQVEVTGGGFGTKQTMAAVADTAGKVATRRAHVRHLLVRASAVLVLILFVASSALSVRAFALYQEADSTTTDVIAASNSLLIELLNAETGQRG